MRVKGWSKFQHFKDRNPPWIKLYRDILSDPDWYELRGETAKTLIMIWLIASEDKGKEGKLPCTRKLAFMLRMTETQLCKQIQELNNYLIHDDINLISNEYQVDAPERAGEETEGETETETEDTLSGKRPDRTPYSEIIGFLNEQSEKDFKTTSKVSKQHIHARWKEGFTLEDFKAVISFKTDEWKTDPEMAQYLRPQTLFGTKFESYLQAAQEQPQAKKSRWVKNDANI